MSRQPVSSRYATSDCSQTATGASRSPVKRLAEELLLIARECVESRARDLHRGCEICQRATLVSLTPELIQSFVKHFVEIKFLRPADRLFLNSHFASYAGNDG